MLPGLLEQGDDLLTLDAGEPFQKLLDRIACFQMIKEASRRDARSREHRLATKHFGILRDHATHAGTLQENDLNTNSPL